jgi:bacteriocin biosynthesis cyclodehydratase domain-containing protein
MSGPVNMARSLSRQRLKSLPGQLIETCDGVILKRGCTELRIGGKGAAEAVKKVLNATDKSGTTRKEICKLFAPQSRRIVHELIDQLLARKVLITADSSGSVVEEPESSLDIFYWHFGLSAARVTERLNERHFTILGVNCISRQLASSLVGSGLNNFQVVDHPLLRNLWLFDDADKLKAQQWPVPLRLPQEWNEGMKFRSADVLVATSDLGAQEEMLAWNRFCVKENRNFLPVVLQDLIGYVGPLVVPGETACYECLQARQNSHLENYKTRRLADYASCDGQRVVGFHPSMASILGDIAAFELTRFYSEALPSRKVGELIEVNLLAKGMTVRKVLKVPRCPICSSLTRRSPVSPDKSFFASINRTVR